MKTLIATYQTTLRQNPKYHNLNLYHFKYLKCKKKKYFTPYPSQISEFKLNWLRFSRIARRIENWYKIQSIDFAESYYYYLINFGMHVCNVYNYMRGNFVTLQCYNVSLALQHQTCNLETSGLSKIARNTYRVFVY
jgi:hypothetical protein